MLKKQLEKLLEDERKANDELRQKNKSLSKELELAKEENFIQKDNYEKSLADIIYNDWKEKKSEFLERFIKELLADKLRIETKCDYGGTIDINLYYDNELIADCSNYIITNRNTLEE